MLSTCNVCINIYILCVSSIIITVYVFVYVLLHQLGVWQFYFFSLLLYLGNISELNPNFSIFYFLFFCPSPNITWPLPLPCGPIVHCHIPYFHLMFFVTTVIINAEYINNMYVLYFTWSHTFSFVLGNSGSCWIPKSLEVEYVLYELASVTCDMCLLPHTCYKCFSMCIMNGLRKWYLCGFSWASCLVVGHQVVTLTCLSNGQNIGDYLVLSFCLLGMSLGFVWYTLRNIYDTCAVASSHCKLRLPLHVTHTQLLRIDCIICSHYWQQ